MPKKKRFNRKLSKKINWKVFIACIIIVFAVAAIGSSFTKIDNWYYSVKPSITPPAWVFPVVWTLLFYLIAISMYFSWLSSTPKQKNKTIVLFAVNFILNNLWSLFYFKMHNPLGAFIVIILLWVSIISLIVYTYKLSKKASYLLIPYLLWVSFAAILNYLSMQ